VSGTKQTGQSEQPELGALDAVKAKPLSFGQFFALFFRILGPEREFYILAVVYGIGISLLSLATPISVQMLINTVANTGLATPLIVLSLTLFGLLLISGMLNALRLHLMEIFGRRFYARLVSEIALRAVYAQNPYFQDESRSALFNRYFDIITVQKTVPVLLISGFTVILQAGVGFVLVSSYHPLFLIFNLITVGLIWIVWMIWGQGAIRSAIDLSHKKHQAAAWIQGVANSNGFFKSERHIAAALTQTDRVERTYIDQHKRHFRQYFSQTISFLIIYAAASATLLGLGGWLVIQGQLSLGQLVAAELVLSAAFFGVSQLGIYLNYFYDLCAAVEELSLFLDIEQEEPVDERQRPNEDSSLSFVNVRGDARGHAATLNFEIPNGSTVMASSSDHGLQRLMANLLKRHEEPEGGYLAFGGGDILETDVNALRQDILILDRPSIIETSIRDYLHLSAATRSPADIIQALKTVGLEPVIADLEEGLDTRLASTGWPLSLTEVMQLKLAAAILAHPRVLVLNQLFDLMREECLSNAIAHLRADKSITVIYFSNRDHDLGFEHFLYLDRQEQHMFDDFEAFRRAGHGATMAALAKPEPVRALEYIAGE